MGIITSEPTANNGGNASYFVTDFSALSSDNFYRIKAHSRSGEIQYSRIVKLAATAIQPSVEVYPNPVTGKLLQLKFTGQMAGTYNINLVSSNGQKFSLPAIQLTSGNTTKLIKIPSFISAGIYRLQIAGAGDMNLIRSIHIAE